MTYKFKVNYEPFISKSNIINSIIDEVKDDDSQLRLTQSINKKTTKIHNKILKDFRKVIVGEIGRLGINAGDVIKYSYNETNNYVESYFSIKMDGELHYNIFITANSDRNFDDSRYTTFTGDYIIKISKGQEIPRYINCSDVKTIKNIDDALSFMSDGLRCHIRINKDRF